MKARIFTIGDEILIGQIVDTNSSYIAKALDIYNSYTPQIQQSLHAYIQTLGLPADANGKYIITDEQSLKNFAYAIQERFYTTQASMQDRLAQAYVRV